MNEEGRRKNSYYNYDADKSPFFFNTKSKSNETKWNEENVFLEEPSKKN